jgi:hypothetical protein
MNVFRKGKMWKVEGSSAKFNTKEEALSFLASKGSLTVEQPVEKEENWSPLEKLRGYSSVCEDCECNPCECEKEWKSVEETLSTTESLKEDLS